MAHKIISEIDWKGRVMELVQLHLGVQCGRCGFESQLYEIFDTPVDVELQNPLAQALEKHAMIPCTLFGGRSRGIAALLEELSEGPRSDLSPCLSMTAEGWREWFAKISIVDLIGMEEVPLSFKKFAKIVETPEAKRTRILKSPDFQVPFPNTVYCLPNDWLEWVENHAETPLFLQGQSRVTIRADELFERAV